MSSTDSPLRDRMIFLVGARRSGTNWLQRVVGAHPDVALVPSETYLFSRGLKQLRQRFHHGVLESPGTGFVYMDEGEMRRSLRELCDRVFLPFLEASPGTTRLAERTPEHVTCLDLIGEIYPDADVVHIIRDGRDVARSLVGQAWGTAPGSLEEAAAEWRDSVDAGRTDGPNLARYRTVSYEKLLTDSRTTVSELYSWLRLPVVDDVVESALIEAGIRFNVDPRAPEVGVGKWREEFSPEDLAAFMKVAGETLEALGYEATSIGPSGGAPVPAPERRKPPPREYARGLRRRIGFGERGSGGKGANANLTLNQRQLDRVVEAMVGRRIDKLREIVGNAFLVRIVGVREQWQGRGEAAWQRLESALHDDLALDGRQIMGDLHAGVPTSIAVLMFGAEDGGLHARTISASFRDGNLVRLTYYRFQVAPAAER